MSDSDSDDVTARVSNAPSASKIEGALRSVVKELQRADRSDELTVNNVRTAAEEKLGLKAGFFKNGGWKDKSKDIIRDQADKEPDSASEAAAASGGESGDEQPPRGKKRKATEANLPKSGASHKSKTRKTSQGSDDDFSDGDGIEDEKKTMVDAKPVRNRSEPEASDESPLSDIDSEEPTKSKGTAKADPDNSESEMSVLDDEDPPPKKRGRKKSTDTKATKPKKAEKAGKASSGGKAKKETSSNSGPDQEEIKKLQGWLVKCGIRKLWGKELAPYEGGKAKIRHLRGMLADVGMTGRFSQDKARQIREARELAADLEAVQEGNKMWGKDSDEEDDRDAGGKRGGGGGGDGGEGKENTPGGRPGRRLAKGLKELDFISDGEETD